MTLTLCDLCASAIKDRQTGTLRVEADDRAWVFCSIHCLRKWTRYMTPGTPPNN